ncbi:ComEC/Rec2 family competence protein [Maritalea sp.]|uniref:ComEC/Rec2 family competence protein n=1 Tax=Maritalea sp. TaxID=2003361 RepID=UPI003EF9B530
MAAFEGETILKSHTQLSPKGDEPVRLRPNAAVKQRKSPANLLADAVSSAIYHRQFIVLLPFALIFGISIYKNVRFEPNWMAVLFVLFVLGICFIWQRIRQRTGRALALTLAAWFGYSLISLSAQWFGTFMISYPMAVDQLSGVVVARTVIQGSKERLVIDQLAGDTRLVNVRRLRLNVKSEHFDPENAFQLGDRIELRARIIPVPKPVYADSYDAQFHSFFAGVGGFASSLGPAKIIEPGGKSLSANIDGLRWSIGNRLDQYLSDQQSGIARALIIGDQSGIASELREEIANAGLAHVLAISGLHLTLVVGSVFILVRLFISQLVRHDRRIKPMAALVAIGVAIAYLLISGSNLATQRATLMLVLAFMAIIVGRRAITMRNVALAAIVIILMFPHEIFKPGFQLSFAAVVGLVAVYAGIGRSAIVFPYWAKLFGGIALTSLIAGIATAPIAAVHFQQFAPLGLLGNLIAVPIVGFFVLPCGLISVLLMPLGLEEPFLLLMGAGIDLIVQIAKHISAISADFTQTPMLANWVLPACLVMLGWLSFFHGKIKFAAPIVFSICLFAFGPARLPFAVISDSTQAIIVNNGASFNQLGRKSNSFTTRAWSERFGADMLNNEAIGNCDKHGCSAQIDGLVISAVKNSVGLREDCPNADILIVRQRRSVSCPNALVITQKELDRFGVATLFRNKTGGFDVKWALDDENRPWRP